MRDFARKVFQTRFDLRKHSRLGMASFLVAILAGLIVIADIGLVWRFQKSPDVLTTFQTLDPALTWLTALLAFGGIILGITGVAQKVRRRLFGVMGLIVNALFLLGIFGLYLANTIGFWLLASR